MEMKRQIFFLSLILIHSGLIELQSQAPTTIMTVSISNKSFPERSDWGESLRITKLDFFVNDTKVGFVSAELGSSNNSTLTYNEFPLSGSEVISKIRITCIHHTWGIFGDKNTTVTKDYTLYTQNISQTGIAGERTYYLFDGLPMVVSWQFTYKIEITPFKPVITGSYEDQCYHLSSELKLNQNNPIYPRTDIYYEWQYGFQSAGWLPNSAFPGFLQNVNYELSGYCYDGSEISCSNISYVIENTDYSFMNDHYDLYQDQSELNRYFIADYLRSGIQNQNYSSLTEAEKNFINDNFISAVLNQPYLFPPNDLTYYVPTWTSIGLSTDVNGSILFSPQLSNIPESSTKIKVTIRVRAVGPGKEGPFSSYINIFVKPKAPTFSYETRPSCTNRPSGSVEVFGLSGVVPGAQYQCYVYNANDPGGNPIYTYNSNFSVNNLSSGTYKIKIYYADSQITGCGDIVTAPILNHNNLVYKFEESPASCPEKSDGQVKVDISSRHGSSSFSLTNIETLSSVSINGLTGTFSNLDNGSYTLRVYDECYTTPIPWPITISQPEPVKITSIEKTDPSCNSSPNGEIKVNASGGTIGNTIFSYQLIKDGSLLQTGTGNPTWSFSGLSGGNYTVHASSGGCSPAVSPGQSLAYVQPVNFSAVPTDVNCFGSNTGSIQVTASGGNNTYLYSRDGIPEATSKFPSLYSGTYLVTVRSTACNDLKQEYVTVGTAPKIDISFTEQKNPSCFEMDDGKLTANITGGTGSYMYSWEQYSNGTWFPEFGSSNVLSGLYAGSYRLNITDSNNCRESKDVSINDPPELIVQSATPADVTCFGGNGSISISASGGNGGNVYSCFEDSGPDFSNSVSAVSVPAGEYNIQVTDKNGCLADYSETILITEPDTPLELSWNSPLFNGFNVSCQGESTGLITVIASGGNGLAGDDSEYEGYLFSVSGSPFQAAGSFPGLPAGSHNLEVRDARGCVVQKPVILTEPYPLSLSLVSSTGVRCFGTPAGEIVVSASGGIENTYKYLIDGTESLSPGIFEDLYADTYEIGVTDLNGCRQNLFATVESLNPPINIIAATKDVRCFGEGNGEINTIVSGGAGGFSYGWEKRSGTEWLDLGETTGSTTNLVPGAYRVKVTDSEECYQFEDIQISEPSLLQVTGVIASDIVCFGEQGSISINASGGTTGYTYYCSAANGDKFESSQPLLPLPAGSYSTSIKDANGCLAVYSPAAIISAPSSPLDFTATLTSYHGYSVSCSGSADGQITVEAAGGNSAGYSGYTFSLMNDPPQANNSFTGLPAGSYSVKVADARGCTLQKSFTLTQPEPVSMNLQSISPVKCFGAATGEIEVITDGGVQGYTYKLNGTPTASSGIFNGLVAGDYTIETIDLNGCAFSLGAIVDHKNPPILTSLNPSPARCYGESNGEILAEVSGGSGGFVYSWEMKSGEEWQVLQSTGTHLENLVAGEYRIRSVDSDNCEAGSTVEVTEPGQLLIKKVGIKDAVCFGDPGSFEIEAAGGNEGYMFHYSPNNNRIIYHDYSPPDPLPAAVYALKVTDSKGCAYEDPGVFYITAPPAALLFGTELSAYGNFNVSCHGNNDGRITVLASGGNGSDYSGYTYQLPGRTVQGESIFTGLEAGTFDLTVTDGRGCRLTKQVTLSEPASEITLKASVFKRPVCAYDTDGAVTLAAMGGSLPYEYSVNSSNYTASAEFTGLAVNDYSFRVRDRNGCSQNFDTALVNIISRMDLSADVTDVKCFGESTGSLNVHVAGGADPFSYSWKDISSTASSATKLLKGSYSVLVTDSAGCMAEETFIVNQPEKPLRLGAVSSPACVGLKDGLIDALASGGTPPYFYAADSDIDFPLPSSFNVYSGNHKVFAKDNNDCLSETQVYVNVRNTMPDINFMLATSRYELDTLVVIDVSVPPPDRVTWEFSPDAVVVDTGRNKAFVRYNQAGLFPVKMTGLFGTCAYTVEKLLNIAPFDPSVIDKDKDKRGIKSLKISPNPNDGSFELLVELYTKQQVTVAVYDIYSKIVFHEKLPADILFVEDINLPGTLMPGTYILRATAENDSRTAVFVISE